MYEIIQEFEKGHFTVRVSITNEDLPLESTFDDSVTDISELYSQIEHGLLEYFVVRVQFFYEGIEAGSDYLGGCLYENAQTAIEQGLDGYLEDMLAEAEAEAVTYVAGLKQKLEADFG